MLLPCLQGTQDPFQEDDQFVRLGATTNEQVRGVWGWPDLYLQLHVVDCDRRCGYLGLLTGGTVVWVC